mmetsp:Transcript_5263/g.10040  ORF Transcript_5263/g.10040 Transcript_5263/m.10040 type:complete len:202 (-) Transcript_5263:794-1399(-)
MPIPTRRPALNHVICPPSSRPCPPSCWYVRSNRLGSNVDGSQRGASFAVPLEVSELLSSSFSASVMASNEHPLEGDLRNPLGWRDTCERLPPSPVVPSALPSRSRMRAQSVRHSGRPSTCPTSESSALGSWSSGWPEVPALVGLHRLSMFNSHPSPDGLDVGLLASTRMGRRTAHTNLPLTVSALTSKRITPCIHNPSMQM